MYRRLFKLGEATAIPDDIPDSYDSKDDLSRFIWILPVDLGLWRCPAW